MAGQREWDQFIPQRKAEFQQFAMAFASAVGSSPWTYGISQSDADTIQRAVDEFNEAFALASSPLTRTPGNVSVKDTKRNQLESLIRMYAAQFRANMGISNASLIEVGVRRRPTKLQRRHCPASSPALVLVARTPGADTLRYFDSLTPNTKAKPYGADRLELFCAYVERGCDVLPTVHDAQYIGSYRKNPIVVHHGFRLHTCEPVYWARWAGHNCDVGNFSLPCSMPIAAKMKESKQTDKAKQAGDAAAQEHASEHDKSNFPDEETPGLAA